MTTMGSNNQKFHEFLVRIKKSPEYPIIKSQLSNLFDALYQENGPKNMDKIFKTKANE
jgi:hypothetical protein